MRLILFFSLLIISCSYFFWQIYRRIRYIRLGRKEKCNATYFKRFKNFLQTVFFHQRIGEYPLSGIFHAFIMYGFIILLGSIVDMAAIALFQSEIPIFNHPVFLFCRDLFIVLVLAGTIGFAVRRIILKIRQENWLHSSYKAYTILALIALIVLTELIYFAAYAVAQGQVLSGAWLVSALAGIFSRLSPGVVTILKELCWWLHYLMIFAFLFIIPNTKHLHLVFAPFNVFLQSSGPKGALKPVLNPGEEQQTCGVFTVEQFTRSQLLDTFSCVQCGRCHRVCPSERSKESLKPKRINGFIRSYLEEEGPVLLKGHPGKRIAGDLFRHDFIWNCTTCGSCNEACPVSIDHLSKLVEMRRSIVSENNNVPSAMREVFQNIELTGSPYGLKRASAPLAAWIKELGLPTIEEYPEADYLLYIGCQATYDESSRRITSALGRLLQTAQVKVAVLGENEWCCGETVRRMGNESLYQKIAKKNISAWQKYGVKKIITICPHCYNTFKNEYPLFGGDFQVTPHVSLLSDLVSQGKLTFAGEKKQAVTYHDPCYLSHFNEVYEAPRLLLSASGINLHEMVHHKKVSLCCGAGGGRFWTRTEQNNPLPANRLNEALATRTQAIITACPYCRTVFREALSGTAEKTTARNSPQVLDIAELLLKYLPSNK